MAEPPTAPPAPPSRHWLEDAEEQQWLQSLPESHPRQAEWGSGWRLSPGQARAGLLLGAMLLGALLLAPLGTLQLLLALIGVLFAAATLLRVAYAWLGLRHPPTPDPPLEDDRLPVFTVVVALYREAAVVEDLCRALAELRYPYDRLEVILACEQQDGETIAACRRHRAPSWKVLVLPPGVPQTKPRALNAALRHATGQLLTIYDAEDRPHPEQLRLAAAGFAARDRQVAALQARLDIYNERDSLISALFTNEYLTLFGAVLPGLARLRHPMPLGGTSTHFRTAALRAVGGWDAWNVTEDCELGMRLAAEGYRSEVLDSVTWEEAVSTPQTWVRQRSRWVKGYAQTLLAMTRSPRRTARAMGLPAYLAALATVGGVPLVLLSQVLTWGLMAAYLTGMVLQGQMTALQPLFPEPLNSLALSGLIGGLLAVIITQALVAHRYGRDRLVLLSLLTPVYVLLGSLAAWKGCLQLLRRPHYWEKTQHGLTAAPALPPAPLPRRARPSLQATAALTGEAVAPALPREALRQDRWLWGASAFSLLAWLAGSWLWSGDRLGFSDAASHLTIPWRVWDNASPGLDQLGLHWLPLYHLLQLPVSWNAAWVAAGWSGLLVSGIAAGVAGLFLYRLARLCRASAPWACATVVGSLAAPSFWFAAVVPMHYTLIVATTTASIFYLVRWAGAAASRDLLACAAWACAASLTHYETWMLLLLEATAVAAVARRRRGAAGVRGDGGIWLLIAGSGLGLFLLLNVWLSGRPLQFLGGFHGSGDVISEAHRGLRALADYPRAVWTLAGPVLTLAGAAGAAAFAWRWRRDSARVLTLLLLAPLLFFSFQAATLGSIIEPYSTLDGWRNLRYALTLLPALVFFTWNGPRRRWLAALLGAATLAAGGWQLAAHQVPAVHDAHYDLGGGAVTVQRAAAWLHGAPGQVLLPVHHRLQDRLQLLSRRPGASFWDSNDRRLPELLGASRRTLRAAGVRWVLALERPAGAPAPLAAGAQLGRPCLRLAASNGSPAVSVWGVDGCAR